MLAPERQTGGVLGVGIRRLSGLAIRDDVGHGALLRRWPSTATGRSRKRASSAITVNTHALFQEDVAFHDLALAIVDEG